jgi:beta-glucanase (GH16 family)
MSGSCRRDVMIGGLASSFPDPVGQAPGIWTGVWRDEFDGAADTSPDTSKWNIRNNTSSSNELSYLTNRIKNVRLGGDSCLHIDCYAETGLPGQPAGHPYTSGYLDTIGLFSRQYGWWEMRAKLPVAHLQSRGFWPAFWLRPDNSGNGDGELDIMESWGTPQSASANFDPANQYSATVWQNESGGAGPHGWSAAAVGPVDLAANFHVFAVRWQATQPEFTFYLDGVQTYAASSATYSWIPASFGGTFNIRLNLQVGSTFWGDPNPPTDTVFPGSYVVDYVRVYQKAS